MNAFELRDDGQGRYILVGELTFATASEVLKATAPLFRAGGTLRFDLAGITRSDSAGVALLIEWMRRAESKDRIRYAHLPEALRAIARVSGVEHLLPVDP